MNIEIVESTNSGSEQARGIYHDVKEVKKKNFKTF